VSAKASGTRFPSRRATRPQVAAAVRRRHLIHLRLPAQPGLEARDSCPLRLGRLAEARSGRLASFGSPQPRTDLTVLAAARRTPKRPDERRRHTSGRSETDIPPPNVAHRQVRPEPNRIEGRAASHQRRRSFTPEVPLLVPLQLGVARWSSAVLNRRRLRAQRASEWLKGSQRTTAGHLLSFWCGVRAPGGPP
jgi:hypothetical protein